LVEVFVSFVTSNETGCCQVLHPVLFFQVNDNSVGKDNLFLGPFDADNFVVGRGFVSLSLFEVVKEDVGFGIEVHNSKIKKNPPLL